MSQPAVSLNGATRERIIRHSMVLFAERGYAGVSVRDVVETVSLTPGAIYHHFANKQALYDVVVEHAFETVSRRLVEQATAATGEALDLRSAVRRFTAYMFDTSPELKLVDRVIFESEPEPALAKVMHGPREALSRILQRTETAARADEIAEQIIAAIYGAAKLRPVRAVVADRARFCDPMVTADSLTALVEAALTPNDASSSLSSQ